MEVKPNITEFIFCCPNDGIELIRDTNILGTGKKGWICPVCRWFTYKDAPVPPYDSDDPPDSNKQQTTKK